MTNFPWLRNAENLAVLGYNFARCQGDCFQFSNNTKYLVQKMEFNTTTFPWPRPFFLKSTTFPGLEIPISNFALLLGWQKPKQWVIQTWRLGNSQQIHEWYSFYCRLKSEGFRLLQFSPYPTPRCCNLSRLISRQYKLWGWGKTG